MISIARHAGWLEALVDPTKGSLYVEFRQADPQHAALVRSRGPWGYAAIRDAVNAASARAFELGPKSPVPEHLEALMPLLWPCLW